MLKVSGLYCYPIKSCRHVVLQTSQLTPHGLTHDRTWMLVDEQGLFISQRTQPRMALIAIEITSTGDLKVTAPEMPSLIIEAHQTTNLVTVKIWKDSLTAELAETHINQWFSKYLKINCRLVRYGKNSQRVVDPDFKSEHINDDQTVAFADGFPLLLAHQASLDLLNKQLIEHNHPAVSMQRFRPNIVFEGDCPAHDEFSWQRLYNNDFKIDAVKPCTRCVITNLDPETAEKTGNTVLSTLAKYHLLNKKATFGINAISQNSGTLSVGDCFHVDVKAHK